MTGATVLNVLRHECSVDGDCRCPHFLVRLAFESAMDARRQIVENAKTPLHAPVEVTAEDALLVDA